MFRSWWKYFNLGGKTHFTKKQKVNYWIINFCYFHRCTQVNKAISTSINKIHRSMWLILLSVFLLFWWFVLCLHMVIFWPVCFLTKPQNVVKNGVLVLRWLTYVWHPKSCPYGVQGVKFICQNGRCILNQRVLWEWGWMVF